MPEPLSSLAPFLNIGLGGLVTLGIIAILTGRLIPASQMERIVRVYAESANDLKLAAADKEETIRVLSEALDENTKELTRLAQLLAREAVRPSEGRGRR